ncbi:MAG: heparan-alpha-glucosaminide N-acetyltransferase domain-containing protein, partial [Promethearchaeota archaeon]
MYNDKSIKIPPNQNDSKEGLPNVDNNEDKINETRLGAGKLSYFRIKSYDFMKGLSMIVIIYLHTIWWLSGPNNYYLFGWCWLFLDLFGPIMYVTLSILSVSYSITYKREIKNQKEKSIFISLLKRFVLLNIIGLFFVINYLDPSKSPFDPLYIFRFHIFQLIAISQLLTYVALKIKPEHRIIIAFIIIFLDRLVYNYILMILANAGISPLNFDSSDLFKSFGDNSILNIGVNIASWAYLLFFRADIDMS